MSKRRVEIGLAALVVIGVGGLLSAVVGLFIYVNATTKPIHPTPADVPSEAGPPPPGRWARTVGDARQLALARLTGQNLPGLSVAVGAGGELVWAEGFGWADLETRARVSPHTRFRIGTSSKVLTSAAVGLLLEQDRLKLDDTIQTYVPAFPQKQWPVTLRQLMGDVAGIRRDSGDEEPIHERCEQTLDGLRRFAGLPLLFEPGTKFSASTYGWILVSAAVEAAAREPFQVFMRRRVFEPLGMDDTRADADVGTSPGQATYYFPRFAADTRYGPQETDEEDFSCFAGAAAFVSTPSDLVRFGLAIGRGTLLAPATVRQLQAVQRLSTGQETGSGLGWHVETLALAGAPAQEVGHDGELRGGTVASFMTFPERGLVVAVIANISHADTRTLAIEIADVFARQEGESGGRP